MTLPQIDRLFRYWARVPPEHEAAAMMLAAYTTWKPATDADTPQKQQASLEERWKQGAMNAADLFALFK
ncbi:MAG: hypothetical protein ACREEN_00540, partial [Stellaceae bacterium]